MWCRQFFNISPAGKILPCHAAETITGLEFESVRSNHSIAWIWQNSEAFNRYRGTGWMPEPCQSCEFKEIDFGGCRCQAFALTGDAGNTDPACTLSPHHERIFKQAEAEAEADQTRFLYRNFAGGTLETGDDHGACRRGGQIKHSGLRPVRAADVAMAPGRPGSRDLRRKRRPHRRHSGGLSAWRARQRVPTRSSAAVRSRALSRGVVRSARRRAKPAQGPPRRQYPPPFDRRHGGDPREIRL